MVMDRIRDIILAGIFLMMVPGLFVLASPEEDSPGWTVPVKIPQVRETAINPLLTYYNGELWLTFDTWGEVNVIHSRNGVEWSPPFIIVEESPKACSFPLSRELLKRPDGKLWLFWQESNEDGECQHVLFCSILEENGTWSAPRELCHIGEDWSWAEGIANRPGGGIVLLEELGVSSGRNELTIRASNEDFEWSPRFLLTSSSSPSHLGMLLDDEGVLRLLYIESGKKGGVFLRTSEDGTTWSEPQRISEEIREGECLVQRKNGQFVLFLRRYPNSIDVSVSSDTLKWSHPTPVVQEAEQVFLFSATESEDGTLWVVFKGGDGFYLTHCSDDNCLVGGELQENALVKNVILALGIAAIALVVLLLVIRRRSSHETNK